LDKALVLNIDDYHNIHVQKQADTTNTSWAAHMATIIANPSSRPAIPRDGAINPKIIDSELVLKHLDRRFIQNLSISYRDRIQESTGDELINALTIHCYNDRITEKREDRNIKNTMI